MKKEKEIKELRKALKLALKEQREWTKFIEMIKRLLDKKLSE